MSEWPQKATALITALGLVAAAASWRLTHAVRHALAVLLDFLTAAVLLRLAGKPSWDSMILAGAVIALRGLLCASLAPPGPDHSIRGQPGAAKPVDASEADITGRDR
ncbi:hypothetical protein AB0Q95_21130 [Streptomyces sp. NPDC059900]|uniref:hypothetical protein n=1 Tax=Streptomyces sp. NPDC059900 TaxID=3155816 RepID=UPI00341FCB0F